MKTHIESAIDFVHPDGFGYAKNREHVAGFVPHQYSEMPTVGDKFKPAPGVESR